MLALKATIALLPPFTSTTLAFPTLGTTGLLRPELEGTIIANEIRSFSFHALHPIDKTIIQGTVQDQVVKRNSTGTLDFYYQINYSSNSTVPLSAVRRDEFKGRLSYGDVDWRMDGEGAVPPSSAFLTPALGLVTIHYAPTGRILPGQESRFVFIGTNATSFWQRGVTYLGVPGTTFWFKVPGCFMPDPFFLT